MDGRLYWKVNLYKTQSLKGGKMRELKFLFYLPHRGGKMMYFSNLIDMSNALTPNDLTGAYISVIYNGVVIGELNTEKVIEEVFTR